MLKQCKPRFHFDNQRLKTGIENTWYRELKKTGKDKHEPLRKRRTEAPPPPRPKQAKLEDQTGSLEEDLARNIKLDGRPPADV